MPKMGPDGQGLNYPGRKNVVVLIEREGNYDIEFCWWGDRTLHAAYVLNPPGVPIEVTITAWPALALHVIVDEINDPLSPLPIAITDANTTITAGNLTRTLVITPPLPMPIGGSFDFTVFASFNSNGTAAVLTKLKLSTSRNTTFPAGAIPNFNIATVNLPHNGYISLYGPTLSTTGQGPNAVCRAIMLEFEQDAIQVADTSINYQILWTARAA